MNKVPCFPVMAIPLSQLLGLSQENNGNYTFFSLSQVSTVSLNFLSVCVYFKTAFLVNPNDVGMVS